MPLMGTVINEKNAFSENEPRADSSDKERAALAPALRKKARTEKQP